jgi:hypothetical protein
VGSTSEQRLSLRMAKHKSKYRRWLNRQDGYTTACELLKYDDCYIDLLEMVIFVNKDMLHSREHYYIRKMNCVNKYRPGEFNRLGRKDYDAEYYKNNREYKLKYKNQKNNCQCGGRYTTTNKSIHFKSNKHREWTVNQWNEFNHL